MIGALIPLLFSFSLVSDTSTVHVGYPYQVTCEMELCTPCAAVYTDDDYLVSTYFDGSISCDMYCNEDYEYLLTNFTLNGQLIYVDGVNNDDYLTVYYQDNHDFNGIIGLDRYYCIHTYADSDYYYFDFICDNQTPLSLDSDFGFSSFVAWGDYSIYFESDLLQDNINGYISTLIRNTQSIYDAGYNNGFNTGYADGYNTGYNNGSTTGYNTGYTDGYTEGATQDETAVAIFSGIISVGLIPINFFLACLNFEVFGINIGAFVSALLTIAIVVIITRMIVSGGNGGKE